MIVVRARRRQLFAGVGVVHVALTVAVRGLAPESRRAEALSSPGLPAQEAAQLP